MINEGMYNEESMGRCMCDIDGYQQDSTWKRKWD